jgi:hypothetical protein
MSFSKAFSQSLLSDLVLAISAHASVASACALDSATTERLLPVLRNATLTEAVLIRHPLVRDRSGLKCNASAWSKRAWCDMLRDLIDAAGVYASDAALLRVYLVCKECAKQGRVQLPLMFQYYDHFLGKAVCIPVVLQIQIDAPLKLVKSALCFARGRAASDTALHQPLPPVGCMQVALFAAQRKRFMFGFTVKVCDRASTVDVSAIEYFRTALRWKTLIFEHVMKGYVGKVEVQLLMCQIACS